MVPFERALADGRYRRAVMVCAAQSGKALALDTPLATPSGWTTMGEVKVGDELFDERGQICHVMGVSPVMTGHPCYLISFCDGSSITADADHRWAVETGDRSNSGKQRRRSEILTTQEMVDRGLKSQDNASRFSIRLAAPLDLPELELPIPPYVLGVWLGDGSSKSGRITSGDQDVEEMTALLEAEGLEVRATKVPTAWLLTPYFPGLKRKRGAAGSLPARLRALNLLGNKHIPQQYFRGSREQRLSLLQGLMDTDGGVTPSGRSIFSTIHEYLARQVCELAASLGLKPIVHCRRFRSGYQFWQVCFHVFREFRLYRITRKQHTLKSISDNNVRPWRNNQRFIRSIDAVESVPVKCVAVDSPSHLYLAGERMIPTHNTEAMLDVMGARLDQRPGPILYVGPSKEFCTDQFEPRLMALLDEAPTLAAKVARGKRMKKVLKLVAGVRVRLAHAGSSTALKSDPAALALVDEYDEMLRNIKGQGDPLGLVEARGDTHADFATGITSTPSRGAVDVETDAQGLEFWKPAPPEDIESPIWKLWQSGTRYHWAWPCPHCLEFFIPRFKCLRWPEGATPSQALRSAWIECPRCYGRVEEHHKAEMNGLGVYVAPGQAVDTDGIVHGDPPESTTVSFWVSGLASPFVSIGQRAERYLQALGSADPDKIQTAVNAGFGELYVRGGGDVPEWQEVAEHRNPYRLGEVPDGVVHLVATVDVQKNRLVYVIRGWGARAESWLIDAGELWGETTDEAVWTDLAGLITTPIDGRPIRLVLIDSGFRPGKPFNIPENRVYAFCRRFPRLVRPSKGYASQRTPVIMNRIEVTASGKTSKYGLELLRLDTDHWKSWIHERIRWPDDQPGAWHLPEDITDDYCMQLVSEARVRKPSGRAEWVQRSRENHFFDAEAMQAAGAYVLNLQQLHARHPPEPAPMPEAVEMPAATPTTNRLRVRQPLARLNRFGG